MHYESGNFHCSGIKMSFMDTVSISLFTKVYQSLPLSIKQFLSILGVTDLQMYVKRA